MYYEKHQIIKRIRDLGMKELPFMIVGVRSKSVKINQFDDKMYLITPSRCIQFDCTTDPGSDWLLRWMNPKGTAVLKPGVWKFKFGMHHGKYECLVQAEPVTVYRDVDKDEIPEEQGVEDTGWHEIHIHRANPLNISKYVGKWSAGCQVLPDPRDFDLLMKECKTTGYQEFSYYLLNEWPIIEKHNI